MANIARQLPTRFRSPFDWSPMSWESARGMAQDVCRRACDISDHLSIYPQHRNVYNRTNVFCKNESYQVSCESQLSGKRVLNNLRVYKGVKVLKQCRSDEQKLCICYGINTGSPGFSFAILHHDNKKRFSNLVLFCWFASNIEPTITQRNALWPLEFECKTLSSIFS